MPIHVVSQSKAQRQQKSPDDLFAVFSTTDPKKAQEIDTNGLHCRKSSLLGFDPLLDDEQTRSQDERGPTSTTRSTPPHRSQHRTSKSVCESDLRELAAQLAVEKPRSLTKEEELNITLGSSLKDSMEQQTLKSKKKGRRKTRSLGVSDMKGSMPKFTSSGTNTPPLVTPSAPERKRPKTKMTTPATPPQRSRISSRTSTPQSTSSKGGGSNPATPKKSPKDKLSPKKSAKDGSTPKKSPKTSSSAATPKKSPKDKSSPNKSPIAPKKSPKTRLTPKKFSPMSSKVVSKKKLPDGIAIPTLSKPSPTSFLKDSEQMAERTSELEPAPHQVTLPTSEEMYVHAKLCALIDTYQIIDPKFDFNMLRNVSSLKLKQFVTAGSSVKELSKGQEPIVKAMLECSSEDVSVEGFFKSEEKGLEVGVFSTASNSVVVYRGKDERQMKPIKSRHAAVPLDPEHNPGLQVYPPFRDAYLRMESQVYKLLDSLMEQNPFLQVVFTGHSFGAALATIGATRFASARPMQRFSCHVFGSPKVGAAPKFRRVVNSLPNLSVMRVELGGDPNVHGPADAASTKYEHVGHTLAIHASVLSGKPLSNEIGSPVLAYKFDARKPTGLNAFTLMARKSDHDIQAYVKALEQFATHKLLWVSLYVGEDVGKGVRGENNEKRLMV